MPCLFTCRRLARLNDGLRMLAQTASGPVKVHYLHALLVAFVIINWVGSDTVMPIWTRRRAIGRSD